MSPSISQLHMALVTTLATRILPELDPDSYATGDARMASVIALLLAQETDRAADTLARENREMRALFKRAAELPFAAKLKEQLLESGDGRDADLRISALTIAHDKLTQVLIELHEAVETDAAAHDLDREIWQFLLKGAESRLLVMPAM